MELYNSVTGNRRSIEWHVCSLLVRAPYAKNIGPETGNPYLGFRGFRQPLQTVALNDNSN
jgi:hypothetical protein